MTENNINMPLPEDIYRHFKGGLYQIVTTAIHSETGESLIIYRSLYGDYKTYARPLSNFTEELDIKKYPEAVTKYRFTKVDRSSLIKKAGEDKAGTASAISVTGAEETSHISEKASSGNHGEKNSALFMEFLDETDFNKKRNILRAMSETVTEGMLNNMAASLDLVLNGVSKDADIKEIDDYLGARIHFDGRKQEK